MRAWHLPLAVIVLVGCGTLQTQLNAVNETTASTMKYTHPALEQQGASAIAACKKAGTMKPPANQDDLDAWAEQCPGFKKLWGVHKAITQVAQGIHAAVGAAGLALIAGQEAEAKAILAKLLTSTVPRLRGLLKQSGLLDLLGL